MKLRVVIAEDETIILQNLEKKLKQLSIEVDIVGMACNGEDALRLVSDHSPHILLTDIRMPLIDGIALIERALTVQPGLLCVVISGYGDFEYAQKAIRLNVFDYLLKPVKPSQLEAVFEKLLKKVTEGQAQRQHDIIFRGYIGDTQMPSCYPNAQFLMCLLCFGSLQTHAQQPFLPDKGRIQSILDAFFDHHTEWWLIDETDSNCKMLIFISYPSYCSQMLLAAFSDFGSCVTLCSSATPIPFSDIWKTGCALRALLRRRLIPFRSACLSLEQSDPDIDLNSIEKLKNAIVLQLGAGQVEQTLQMIKRLLDALCPLPQQIIEKYLTELLKSAEASSSSEGYTAQAANMLNRLAACAREDTFVAELLSLWQPLICASGGESGSAVAVYQAIKDYMDAHFNEDITMQSIGELFHFSPEYISRLFRRLYGQPPMKYLTALRLEEAQRLIRQSSYLNLRMIAEMVGYPDAHYFSRIFRKTTGLSPSEYKEQHTDSTDAGLKPQA